MEEGHTPQSLIRSSIKRGRQGAGTDHPASNARKRQRQATKASRSNARAHVTEPTQAAIETVDLEASTDTCDVSLAVRRSEESPQPGQAVTCEGAPPQPELDAPTAHTTGLHLSLLTLPGSDLATPPSLSSKLIDLIAEAVKSERETYASFKNLHARLQESDSRLKALEADLTAERGQLKLVNDRLAEASTQSRESDARRKESHDQLEMSEAKILELEAKILELSASNNALRTDMATLQRTPQDVSGDIISDQFRDLANMILYWAVPNGRAAVAAHSSTNLDDPQTTETSLDAEAKRSRLHRVAVAQAIVGEQVTRILDAKFSLFQSRSKVAAAAAPTILAHLDARYKAGQPERANMLRAEINNAIYDMPEAEFMQKSKISRESRRETIKKLWRKEFPIVWNTNAHAPLMEIIQKAYTLSKMLRSQIAAYELRTVVLGEKIDPQWMRNQSGDPIEAGEGLTVKRSIFPALFKLSDDRGIKLAEKVLLSPARVCVDGPSPPST